MKFKMSGARSRHLSQDFHALFSLRRQLRVLLRKGLVVLSDPMMSVVHPSMIFDMFLLPVADGHQVGEAFF